MTGYGGADRFYHWGGGVPPYSEKQINVLFEGGALINKTAANIVPEKDTIDAQAMLGMPYGRNATEPSKPTLQFPFMSFRMLKKGDTKDNKQFEQAYQNLLNDLPKDLREKLKSQIDLPIASRDPVYSGLDKTLSLTAITMGWLEKIAKPLNEDSEEYRHAQSNLELTEKAIHNLILQGERVIRDGLLYLQKMGRNHPQYDSLLQFLKDIARTIKLLKKIIGQTNYKEKDSEENSEDDEDNENEKKAQKPSKTYLKNASAFIDSVNEEYHHKSDQEQLQMIGAILQSISVLNSTQSLNAGLKSILYGMVTLHIGISTQESEAGIIGAETKKYIDTYSKILTEAFLRDLSPGERLLIPMLITSTTLITITAALYLIESDTHVIIESSDIFEDEIEQLSEKDRILTNIYALENIMNMLLTLDYFSSLIPENNLVEKNVNTVATGIELLISSLIIKVVSVRYPDTSPLLIDGLSDRLIERYSILEEAYSSIKSVNLSEFGIDSRQIEIATLHLANCRRSLENKNNKQYIHALDEFIASFSINSTAYEDELSLFYSLAKSMKSSLEVDLKDYTNALTGISQI
ncbi:MAG: hypothetical protein VX777_08065 [Chlamydiota bacterium]|nr:hypothetical protein [Chlamydiota bacterium]